MDRGNQELQDAALSQQLQLQGAFQGSGRLVWMTTRPKAVAI
jgi:hypothetical protein